MVRACCRYRAPLLYSCLSNLVHTAVSINDASISVPCLRGVPRAPVDHLLPLLMYRTTACSSPMRWVCINYPVLHSSRPRSHPSLAPTHTYTAPFVLCRPRAYAAQQYGHAQSPEPLYVLLVAGCILLKTRRSSMIPRPISRATNEVPRRPHPVGDDRTTTVATNQLQPQCIPAAAAEAARRGRAEAVEGVLQQQGGGVDGEERRAGQPRRRFLATGRPILLLVRL